MPPPWGPEVAEEEGPAPAEGIEDPAHPLAHRTAHPPGQPNPAPPAGPTPLEPLGEDERPPALLAAVAVCGLLALAVIIGAATVHDLSRHGGSLPGAVFLALVLALLAFGMYEKRYWAVLGFEALLAFQILVTSLALVVASTIAAAAACLLSIGLGGWLFWKLVRVMGRIQAGER
jgi:hypothetical protein